MNNRTYFEKFDEFEKKGLDIYSLDDFLGGLNLSDVRHGLVRVSDNSYMGFWNFRGKDFDPRGFYVTFDGWHRGRYKSPVTISYREITNDIADALADRTVEKETYKKRLTERIEDAISETTHKSGLKNVELAIESEVPLSKRGVHHDTNLEFLRKLSFGINCWITVFEDLKLFIATGEDHLKMPKKEDELDLHADRRRPENPLGLSATQIGIRCYLLEKKSVEIFPTQLSAGEKYSKIFGKSETNIRKAYAKCWDNHKLGQPIASKAMLLKVKTSLASFPTIQAYLDEILALPAYN